MESLITVDGVAYNLRIRTGDLERSARIEDGINAGQLKSGAIAFDTIGTFIDYTLVCLRDGFSAATVAAYDSLYEVLTDPLTRMHTLVVPYGQGTLTYTAYITNVRDRLKKRRAGVNYWDEMEISFTAQRPQKTPY